ncbi:MGMT family protein [Candidatus Woesearchaeota archaeon]|nr:MGMT family protein [Candidatus Woesearchaeota archaeon]
MKLAEKIYELCKQIPEGKISTYLELGKALDTKAYRAIGQCLKNNPNAPSTPCHRVVSSSGDICGFKGKTSGKEIQKKIKMLEKEGIKFQGEKIVDFEKVLFKF